VPKVLGATVVAPGVGVGTVPKVLGTSSPASAVAVGIAPFGLFVTVVPVGVGGTGGTIVNVNPFAFTFQLVAPLLQYGRGAPRGLPYTVQRARARSSARKRY
jgi:hypothetical protein